jgi:tetratricopeptide (TPR) repeat protein
MRRSRRTLPEDLAGALRILSAAAIEEGNAVEAESSALEALEVAETRLGPRHNQVVLSLVDLCYAFASSGKHALAIATGERARDWALEVYSQRSTHPNVLKAREAYAFALAASGESDNGIREMNDAIRDTASSFGVSSRAEGFALRRLALMQLYAGRPEQALETVNRAVSILSEHLNRESPGFARTLELRGRILAAAQTRFVANGRAADFHQRRPVNR